MGDYTTQYIRGLFHKPLPIKQAVFHEKYSAVVFFRGSPVLPSGGNDSSIFHGILEEEGSFHLPPRPPWKGIRVIVPWVIFWGPANFMRIFITYHDLAFMVISHSQKKRVVKAHMCINHQFQGFNVKTWMEQINPTCFVFVFILFFCVFKIFSWSSNT